jgi:hypothetical protein
MWRPRRKDPNREAAAGTVLAEEPREPHADLGQSLDDIRTEIETLTRSNQGRPDRETERRLVALRHLAGVRLIDDASDGAVFAGPDEQALPVAEPLPEISGADLTPELVRAGILRDGCVLVRGLVPRASALGLAERIDRAFDERERHESGGSPAPGYYEEFSSQPRFGDVVGRNWIKQGGGLLAADAPMLHFEMMEMFRAARLGGLVSGYLGEPALISVHKTTLRKADPSVPGAWHQDGFFMGEVRSLNLWLSLSRCGDEAPGLDILPRRLDHYLATATDEAVLDYTISQRQVEQTAGNTPVIRPIFEPGDALFFDELFLHQTGSDPSMPNPRYAVENWFFGGSGFPAEYAPIAV